MKTTTKAWLLIVSVVSASYGAPPAMISLGLSGKNHTGLPLQWTPGNSVLLDPDGQLWYFKPSEATNIRSVTSPFRASSRTEMQRQLYAEFGRSYKITATSSYLVVHPPRGKHWPEVLERLHRSFIQFSTTRKLPIRKGKFPMVAIVFPDQASFMRYSANDRGGLKSTSVLGYYSPRTNRVAMYDHGDSSGGVSSTIRHEAAHQSAFNLGIHSRVARTPHWIVEGVGTLFEADGIHDPSRNRSLKDRANRLMLEAVRENYPTASSMTPHLERLVSDDSLFRISSERAYALSWALTFYLADRRPDALRKMIVRYTDRTPFEAYSSTDRSIDFSRDTGMSMPMLSSQIHQFLNQIK